MRPESKFASSLSEEIDIEEERPAAPFDPQNIAIKTITVNVVSKRRESKLDKVSTSVVIGMTALFVVSILCLVTEFAPRLIDNILFSLFVGLCVGVIAFALMKDTD